MTSAKVCPFQTLSTELLLSCACLSHLQSARSALLQVVQSPEAGSETAPWPSCGAPLTMMAEERWLLLPFCGRYLSIQSGGFNLGNHYSKSRFRPVDIAASTFYLFS